MLEKQRYIFNLSLTRKDWVWSKKRLEEQPRDTDIPMTEGDKLRDGGIWELPMILSDNNLSCQLCDPSLGDVFMKKILFSDSYLFFIYKWLYSMLLGRKIYNKKNLIRTMFLSKIFILMVQMLKKKNNLLNNVMLLYFFLFAYISVDRDFDCNIRSCNYNEDTFPPFLDFKMNSQENNVTLNLILASWRLQS